MDVDGSNASAEISQMGSARVFKVSRVSKLELLLASTS